MTRARSALVGLLIGAPFYLLLIDTTTAPELIAGGVAAVLAAGAYQAAYVETAENTAIRARWLLRAWSAAAQVPSQVLIVCAEVASQTIAPRSRRGAIVMEPFKTGSGDPQDVGHRALTEALRSLAPATIVIGIDPESDRLVVHELRPPR